jgi:flavin-dependent thymidylate synthase
MSQEIVRAADAAQYAREPIPETQRGQIRVRLLNATPDPLGSIAALGKQYKGEVVRDLSEVTDEERRSYLNDFGNTVLSGPLEAAQFHFQIEGVTRSITHQMVRSRASFFAQESLRFAVPEGDWDQEIPVPPSLAGARQRREKYIQSRFTGESADPGPESEVRMLDTWEDAMLNAQIAYTHLIEMGMPAEEARGVLPHDMPTRIHWVLDLRTLLAEAGKRTCTQAQFPWRIIFAGMAKSLREWGTSSREIHRPQSAPEYISGDSWQFREIANKLRPVCYQTGSCGFMAEFDRSCKIRSRVDSFAREQVPSSKWSEGWTGWVHEDGDEFEKTIKPINDAEWAADPSAARS